MVYQFRLISTTLLGLALFFAPLQSTPRAAVTPAVCAAQDSGSGGTDEPVAPIVLGTTAVSCNGACPATPVPSRPSGVVAGAARASVGPADGRWTSRIEAPEPHPPRLAFLL